MRAIVFERLVRDAGADPDVSANLALAYIRTGRNRDAAGVYQNMLRRRPDDVRVRRELLALLGDVLEEAADAPV